MEEARFLGIGLSQLPIAALILAVSGIIITLLIFAINAINAANANANALRAEMIGLRSDMNANDNALRSEFRADLRALEERFDRRIDALSADVVAIKIDLALIKRRVGVIEDGADASADAD